MKINAYLNFSDLKHIPAKNQKVIFLVRSMKRKILRKPIVKVCQNHKCCYFCTCFSNPGEYQSGQLGQTVNLLAYAFGGSNPPPPTFLSFNIVLHHPEGMQSFLNLRCLPGQDNHRNTGYGCTFS